MKFKHGTFVRHLERGILCTVCGVGENHVNIRVINGGWDGTILLGQDKIDIDRPYQEGTSCHCDEEGWEEVFPPPPTIGGKRRKIAGTSEGKHVDTRVCLK